MITPAVGRPQTRQHALTMASRVAGLLQPPADIGTRIPKADWTVGEAAAHTAFAKRLMARIMSGEAIYYSDGTREGLAAANAQSLAAAPERDGQALAQEIEDATKEFCSRSAERSPGEVVNGPLGPMPVEVFEAYVLTHLMQHGEAIARALRRPTVLDRSSVVAATPFIFFALEKFPETSVIEGLNVTYGLHLRGGPTVYVRYRDGECRVSEAREGKVDCHISADPVAMFRVGVRLISQWGPIAQFKLMTWGPKPWLAFRFAGTFRPP